MCRGCYQRWFRRERAYGRMAASSLFTSAEPVQQHALALRAAGVGLNRITELSGLPQRTVRAVCSRKPKTVRKSTADAILSVPLPRTPHAEQLAKGKFIDSAGTLRRLQALVLAGHPMSHLSAKLGRRPEFVSGVLSEQRPSVTAKLARDVAALFSDLECKPGPSLRARLLGERQGWAPAIAWDEDTIDDPKIKPQHNVRRHVRFAERYEELREIERVPVKQVSAVVEYFETVLKAKPENVQRQIDRYKSAERKAQAS